MKHYQPSNTGVGSSNIPTKAGLTYVLDALCLELADELDSLGSIYPHVNYGCFTRVPESSK
jgi:hypothetical protein